MRASQELLKEEKLVKMETKQGRMEANQEKMDAKPDANHWTPGQTPIRRSSRSFIVLLSPGWLSTIPGQCPLQKK
jgi:hypothetical protein